MTLKFVFNPLWRKGLQMLADGTTPGVGSSLQPFYPTITQQMLDDKKILLPSTPAFPQFVLLDINSGSPQIYGLDFYVEDNYLKWDGKRLDGQMFLETEVRIIIPSIADIVADMVMHLANFDHTKIEHANRVVLDAIQEAFTTTLKSAYDSAVSASHSHTNKTTLDAIEEAFTTVLKTAYDSAVAAMHSHSNKAILDSITGINASNFGNDSSVIGTTIKDALNNLGNKFLNIIPQDGAVLPISASRAYFEKVLYSPTAIFKDGTNLYKYVAFYGNGTNTSVAYSNDGINWTSEATVTGIAAGGYHCAITLVGTIIHMFYWQGSLLYTPAATRHATFDITVDCKAATSDNALSGNYITGVFDDGLRYGCYGAYEIFYNAAPTNNVLDPYSYQWCMIHSGTTGSHEGVLFATSSDGLDFSAWNGTTEVISCGTYPEWDSEIGALSIFKYNGLWCCYYSGGVGTSHGADSNFGDGIGFATSSDGITWVKSSVNPVIFKTYATKASKRLYCPCVVLEDNGWRMYFSTKNNAGAYKVSKAVINLLS